MSEGPKAVILAALVLALLVAGCGGGGDGGEEVTTSSLSKAQFIAKADAACAKNQRETERDFAAFAKRTHFKVSELTQLSANPSKADVNGLVNTVVIPAVKREVTAIRELGAPNGDEDKVEAILVAAEEGIQTAEGLRRKVLEQPEIAFGVGGRLAKEYGLAICGQH